MNIEKLERVRETVAPTLDIDAGWRYAMTDLIDALLEDDDAGCPPWPKEGMTEREARVLRECAAKVESLGGFGQVVDVLRDTADDIEQPRVDRSLRGWVIVDESSVYWASEKGLGEATGDAAPTSWSFASAEGWAVRKLTPKDIGFRVRYPGEWTATEEDELKSFCRGTYDIFSIADKAIDIALRGNYE